MIPTWERDGISLYLGDCLQVLPTLAAGSVDVVVTDPVWPNADVQLAGSDDPAGLLNRCLGLMPGGVRRIVVQLGCDSDPRFLSAVPDRWGFLRVCWLEYVRPGYKGRLLYTGDVAYVFGEPPRSEPGRHLMPGKFILRNGEPRPVDHPCARQYSHVHWLVDKFSSEGEAVCDPFLGSGTTGEAAARLGRRFVGIEIEPRYFEIAVKNIEAAMAQMRLPM